MNLGFEKINVYYDGDNNSATQGRVVLEPLERGFARTMGNTLRRVLISSMPGTSACGLKVNGVYHEFSSIPNATTDMVELILNLKKVRFKLDSDDELVTVRFSKSKEGVYTSNDIELPTGVEVLNKNQEIISLDGNGEVEFEVYVKSSRGYVDSSQHDEFEDRPDVIAIDGMFSPIKKVGYDNEKMRIGQNANFERLILNVETDGSIEPKDAVMLAGKIVKSHFNFFEEMSDIAEKTEVYQEKKEEEDRILDLPIEHLDLSVRSYGCLKRNGFTNVRKILNLSEQQLYSIHQMGKKSVIEVIDKVKELGFELKKD